MEFYRDKDIVSLLTNKLTFSYMCKHILYDYIHIYTCMYVSNVMAKLTQLTCVFVDHY